MFDDEIKLRQAVKNLNELADVIRRNAFPLPNPILDETEYYQLVIKDHKFDVLQQIKRVIPFIDPVVLLFKEYEKKLVAFNILPELAQEMRNAQEIRNLVGLLQQYLLAHQHLAPSDAYHSYQHICQLCTYIKNFNKAVPKIKVDESNQTVRVNKIVFNSFQVHGMDIYNAFQIWIQKLLMYSADYAARSDAALFSLVQETLSLSKTDEALCFEWHHVLMTNPHQLSDVDLMFDNDNSNQESVLIGQKYLNKNALCAFWKLKCILTSPHESDLRKFQIRASLIRVRYQHYYYNQSNKSNKLSFNSNVAEIYYCEHLMLLDPAQKPSEKTNLSPYEYSVHKNNQTVLAMLYILSEDITTLKFSMLHASYISNKDLAELMDALPQQITKFIFNIDFSHTSWPNYLGMLETIVVHFPKHANMLELECRDTNGWVKLYQIRPILAKLPAHVRVHYIYPHKQLSQDRCLHELVNGGSSLAVGCLSGNIFSGGCIVSDATAIVKKMPKSPILDLSGNRRFTYNPNAIPSLPEPTRKELRLRFQNIVADIIVGAPSYITHLDLSDNDFGEYPLDTMLMLLTIMPSHITSIDLSCNRFDHLSDDAFKQLLSAFNKQIKIDLRGNNLMAHIRQLFCYPADELLQRFIFDKEIVNLIQKANGIIKQFQSIEAISRSDLIWLLNIAPQQVLNECKRLLIDGEMKDLTPLFDTIGDISKRKNIANNYCIQELNFLIGHTIVVSSMEGISENDILDNLKYAKVFLEQALDVPGATEFYQQVQYSITNNNKGLYSSHENPTVTSETVPDSARPKKRKLMGDVFASVDNGQSTATDANNNNNNNLYTTP